MRIIVSEEQFNKLNRSSPALQNGINKYLNRYIIQTILNNGKNHVVMEILMKLGVLMVRR